MQEGLGYHPLLAWLNNTHDALAGHCAVVVLAATLLPDDITVTDQALHQIPDHQLYGQPVPVRSAGAGATKE